MRELVTKRGYPRLGLTVSCVSYSRDSGEGVYRGTWLIRNTLLLGPYSRTKIRVLWWPGNLPGSRQLASATSTCGNYYTPPGLQRNPGFTVVNFLASSGATLDWRWGSLRKRFRPKMGAIFDNGSRKRESRFASGGLPGYSQVDMLSAKYSFVTFVE